MYSIGIRIEKIEKRKSNTRILHVTSGLFLLVKAIVLLKYEAYKNFITVFPFLLFGIAWIFYAIIKKKYDPLENLNGPMRITQVLAFTTLGILMVYKGRSFDYIVLFLWAMLNIYLFYSERRSLQPTRVHFTDNEILIPGFFRDRKLSWTGIKNAVIKEDFITLFLSNEKYMQYEVAEDISEKYIEEVNNFCRQQIKAQPVSPSD